MLYNVFVLALSLNFKDLGLLLSLYIGAKSDFNSCIVNKEITDIKKQENK